MLLDWDTEHPARSLAVEVFALAEGLEGDFFAGEPREDSGFDCAEVGDDEPVVFTGDEGGADELAQAVW